MWSAFARPSPRRPARSDERVLPLRQVGRAVTESADRRTTGQRVRRTDGPRHHRRLRLHFGRGAVVVAAPALPRPRGRCGGPSWARAEKQRADRAAVGRTAPARELIVFRNVLVWIDGSASAAQALITAVEMARASRGRLGLLSVVGRPSRGMSLARPPFALPVSHERLAAQLDADAQRLVEDGARAVPADVPVTKLLSRGSMADALLEHTRSGPWDLVVVGLRSASDHRPLRRGVGARLLRASSIPVLVVWTAPSPPKRSLTTARPSARAKGVPARRAAALRVTNRRPRRP